MKVFVQLQGEEKAEHCQSLISHLEDADLLGIEDIQQRAIEPSDDALGFDWVQIVQIALSSSVLTTLIAKIMEWKMRQRAKTEIEIEIDGKRIKIASDELDKAVKSANDLIALVNSGETPSDHEKPLELKPLQNVPRKDSPGPHSSEST